MTFYLITINFFSILGLIFIQSDNAAKISSVNSEYNNNGDYCVNNNEFHNSNQFIMHPWFITGLTDADGTFYVKIIKSTSHNLGWQVQILFRIIAEVNLANLKM